MALDDLNYKVRSQIVSGIDILTAVKQYKEEAQKSKYDENVDIDARLKQLSSSITYSDQVAELVESLDDKEKIEKLLSLSHDPSRDVDYYILLKLVLMCLKEQELAPLFDRWMSINVFPLSTNIMAWSCIDEICGKLCVGPLALLRASSTKEFDTKVDHLIPLDSHSKNKNFRTILRYIFALKVFEKSPIAVEIGAKFTKYCLCSLQEHKFPKANESNEQVDLLIIACIYLLHQYPHSKLFDAHSIAEKALYVSYHSIPVMKLWCFSAISEKKSIEVLPVFKTYLHYVTDTIMKHGNDFFDPVGTIETYVVVISHVTQTWENPERELFERVCDWVGELKSCINDFIKFVCASSELYTTTLRQYMSSIWFRLGFIYERLCFVYTTAEDGLDKRIDSACRYYKKSIDLIECMPAKQVEFADYYYRYALIMAKKLEYSEAIKAMKQALKIDPNAVEYLNVIVLLYSAVEDSMSKPLGIAREVLESFKAGDWINRPLKDRLNVLQMYMTFIALVEASSSCFEALDFLQELFNLAHKLLGVSATMVSENGSSKTKGDLVRIISSHRPSIRDPKDDLHQLLRTAKPKRGVFNLIRTKKINKPKSDLVKRSQQKEGQVPQIVAHPSDEEKRIMHHLWLWSSKLFEKCGQLSDAEGCIKEAESVYQKTSDSYARLGQLLLNNNPKLALQQLEIALEMSQDTNVEAILGFAKLVLSEDGKKVFIGEQDERAAVGRCQNYLQILSYKYECLTMSEIYYYLSEIYERYNDEPMVEKTLWKVISLEGKRPVRTLQGGF
ncbi:hypothetical protein FOA43_001921 [Brettanomyces nanus]|uniref:Cargo-transport protein YPP1 n=1 Tax=Eeniella nana TaxID=13502 RepID=A0A875RP53_EENNA|nr:uncharacterized protein FOA43_001921 [Brettanomyces nanus]QPG74590.1 hypothetical protein FOA43_001921 [Brettanomyces nanus]